MIFLIINRILPKEDTTFRNHETASEHHQASLERLVGELLILRLFPLLPQHVCLSVAMECCTSIHDTLLRSEIKTIVAEIGRDCKTF